MTMTTLIGLLAATLTTISFVPQAVRVLRTGHTADLSLVMYVILTTGVLLWLVYGLLLHNIPIIVANAVTLCLTSAILLLVLKDRLKKK